MYRGEVEGGASLAAGCGRRWPESPETHPARWYRPRDLLRAADGRRARGGGVEQRRIDTVEDPERTNYYRFSTDARAESLSQKAQVAAE